jgi:hypothetical protein
MTLDKEFLFEASLLLNLDHDFSPFAFKLNNNNKKSASDRAEKEQQKDVWTD